MPHRLKVTVPTVLVATGLQHQIQSHSVGEIDSMRPLQTPHYSPTSSNFQLPSQTLKKSTSDHTHNALYDKPSSCNVMQTVPLPTTPTNSHCGYLTQSPQRDSGIVVLPQSGAILSQPQVDPDVHIYEELNEERAGFNSQAHLYAELEIHNENSKLLATPLPYEVPTVVGGRRVNGPPLELCTSVHSTTLIPEPSASTRSDSQHMYR